MQGVLQEVYPQGEWVPVQGEQGLPGEQEPEEQVPVLQDGEVPCHGNERGL